MGRGLVLSGYRGLADWHEVLYEIEPVLVIAALRI